MHHAVVAGVGQLKHCPDRIDDAREPLDLIEEAARAALSDARASDSLLASIDRVVVIRTDSWRYDGDVGARLASRLGIPPSAGMPTKHGGHQPVAHLHEVAQLLARGRIRSALICGGESYASRRLFTRGGETPPWTPSSWGALEPGLEAGRSALGKATLTGAAPTKRKATEAERHGLTAPIRVYPLYENALKARLGLSFAENQEWSGRIYSDLSKVAARHPVAWNPEPKTASQITRIDEGNRMICFPYTLLMNAFAGVDQAAALLVMSAEVARELGLHDVVYVWAGYGSSDTEDIGERVGYDRSRPMIDTLRGLLDRTNQRADDVAHLDIYSCFPVVPKLATEGLGLSNGRAISVTGGLTFFGGPGNDYSTHALATMTTVLRNESRALGLVYGQGHYVTEHHAVLLGTDPPPSEWLAAEPEPGRCSDADRDHTIVATPERSAAIETYTVEFDRGGTPVRGWIIGRDTAKRRFVATTDDGDTLGYLISEKVEPVGTAVHLDRTPAGLNSFRLDA
jgi:acetyl-CoA C-acetyltransferase